MKRLSIILLVLLSCCAKYERQENCDLDKLNVKGNVLKIETIVKSTVPMTEMFYETYNPEYVVTPSDGNYVVKFDKKGNVDTYTGYDMYGEELFSVKNRQGEKQKDIIPGFVGAIVEKLENIEIVDKEKDAQNKVVEIKWNKDGELKYINRLHYDKDGNISYISKKYITALDGYYKNNAFLGDIDFNYYDTTFYFYSKYDEHGNWTEMEAVYHGVFPRHNYSYVVKRQITYDDSKKQPALIKQLANFNRVQPQDLSKTKMDMLNGFGQIEVPVYLDAVDDETTKKLEFQTLATSGITKKHLCNYKYNGNDSYATLSISEDIGGEGVDYDDLSSFELCYDKSVDIFFKEQVSTMLRTTQTDVLKWLPYTFTKVSGKTAMLMRYYRYGISCPIPVYVELYSFQTRQGRNISISLSYQSNHYNRFHDDFEAAIKSLEIN